jgi:hypothetical protein
VVTHRQPAATAQSLLRSRGRLTPRLAWWRVIIQLRGRPRHDILAGQPATEGDVGAAWAAKRAVRRDGGTPADRAERRPGRPRLGSRGEVLSRRWHCGAGSLR